MKRTLTTAITALSLAAGCSNEQSSQSPKNAASHYGTDSSQMASGKNYTQNVPTVGNIETVATFDGPMPTGVTVSQTGRIFVNFPRWGDRVEFTVAELKDGKPVAFPDAEINAYDAAKVAERLVSVQSVVVDPSDRLWMLDTGSLQLGPAVPGGPKLVGVDLKTNQVFKTIHFPADVAPSSSYLNDVRFDLRRGRGGMAFITDSGNDGPNGIVVVDLDSGKSWRRLSGHPSVKADENFVPTVEGEQLKQRPAPGVSMPMRMGSDGIAISADGKTLYYCPLASRRLHSVSVDALADPNQTDRQVAATVKKVADRDYASDGLESDAAGNLYLTDYEHNAVHRRGPDGRDRVIAQAPKMIWPDTMSVASDGYIYFTANQLNRQKTFHEGKDLREKPYYLFRVKPEAGPVPVLLK